MDEQRERWKVFEAEKRLQHMNHILRAKGWRLEVLYDQTGTALDAYPRARPWAQTTERYVEPRSSKKQNPPTV
jgi:hypothetical protein